MTFWYNPFADQIETDQLDRTEDETEIEYWEEKDSDIDDDFPLILNDHASNCEETDIDETQGAIIWWAVASTAIFETLHTIPTRAVIWLLNFLWCLFLC